MNKTLGSDGPGAFKSLFAYPAHDPIPTGWKMERLSDLMTFLGGAATGESIRVRAS